MSAGGQPEATGDVAARLRELEARDRARTQLLDLLRGFLNPGEEGLFAAVARALAALRDAAFVTVSEIISLQRIRTLAFFSEGELRPNFEYDITGTPCENVVARAFYACPERARELFPHDKYLCDWGVESYLGTPLFDRDGQPLGNIAILSRAPATDIPAAEELLRVCAVYVSAEIERRRAERKQLEHQKMEAVGQLAGGIAHDFNNLLTIILGTAGLMACDIVDPELQNHLTNIQNAAERGAAMTRQLLAYSRRQVLAPTVLDVRAVIGELARMLGPILREDVDLVIQHAPDLGHVLADRSQFEQVVLNLAINAREAMPDGGTLKIETANVVLDRIYTDTHVDLRPGQYVLVAVSDTGTGMAPATLLHAFDPFFSTKQRGSGLGLATVQGIVRQGGGHIAAYSEPGRGTTFKVYMPRADAPGLPVDATREPELSPHGTETVLVVDDDPRVLDVVRAMLGGQGYQVLTAPDAEAALEHVAREPAIDLIITDIVLPRVEGPELHRRTSSLRPGLPVLYISGFTDKSIVQQGTLDGGAAFLQKPFTAVELARKVRLVLDRRSTAHKA